ELGNIFADAFGISGAPTSSDAHVTAIDPAQFLQALQESSEACLAFLVVRRQAYEHADVSHALLSARRNRARRYAAQNHDELAPPHSITSSAVASSDGGIVRPNALAVL